MTKNLSENARLRLFLVRDTEEIWICRFSIAWDLEKWGVLKGGLRGLLNHFLVTRSTIFFTAARYS